jgi:hypothetical protein
MISPALKVPDLQVPVQILRLVDTLIPGMPQVGIVCWMFLDPLTAPDEPA